MARLKGANPPAGHWTVRDCETAQPTSRETWLEVGHACNGQLGLLENMTAIEVIRITLNRWETTRTATRGAKIPMLRDTGQSAGLWEGYCADGGRGLFLIAPVAGYGSRNGDGPGFRGNSGAGSPINTGRVCMANLRTVVAGPGATKETIAREWGLRTR